MDQAQLLHDVSAAAEAGDLERALALVIRAFRADTGTLHLHRSGQEDAQKAVGAVAACQRGACAAVRGAGGEGSG